MKLSENGKLFIIKEEGEVLNVYLDQIGLKTAGVGHLLPKTTNMKVGEPITKEQSRKWVEEDVSRFEEGVSMSVKIELSQTEFDALVSFAFNVGMGNFLSSTMLKLLNAGRTTEAAAQFTRWNKAGGKVMPVLVGRRKREQRLFSEGSYGF